MASKHVCSCPTPFKHIAGKREIDVIVRLILGWSIDLVGRFDLVGRLIWMVDWFDWPIDLVGCQSTLQRATPTRVVRREGGRCRERSNLLRLVRFEPGATGQHIKAHLAYKDQQNQPSSYINSSGTTATTTTNTHETNTKSPRSEHTNNNTPKSRGGGGGVHPHLALQHHQLWQTLASYP